ncbi:MAG: N-6 DNA methylase, partial [Mangrovibacterium sp.]
MSYNKKEHLRQNIDAIKLAFRLQQEKRQATSVEREVLLAYSGFGGIKAILNPAEKVHDLFQWQKYEHDLFPLVQELHELLRANSDSEKEYKRLFSSLKNSTLTAFYTPQPIIDALTSSMQNHGISPQNILEPSAGIGAFISSFQAQHPQAQIVGFEKDELTGLILSQLYPDAQIRVQGYEQIGKDYNGAFDIVSSNIPFGDLHVFDSELSRHEHDGVKQSTKAIHNYFFTKSVQTVREGGIIAFITSQGVLNNERNRPVREYLMQQCDVVSVVRLPNNLFVDNAGTEVGSDLIILQKNTLQNGMNQHQRNFIECRKLSNGISINNSFQDFSKVLHTASKIDSDPYGKTAIIFTHGGGIESMANDLQRMLDADFKQHLNIDRYRQYTPKRENTQAITIPQAPQPVQAEKPAHQMQAASPTPIMTLYDLFGMSEAETKPQSRKNNTNANTKQKAIPQAILRLKENQKKLLSNLNKAEENAPLEWREELILKGNQRLDRAAARANFEAQKMQMASLFDALESPTASGKPSADGLSSSPNNELAKPQQKTSAHQKLEAAKTSGEDFAHPAFDAKGYEQLKSYVDGFEAEFRAIEEQAYQRGVAPVFDARKEEQYRRLKAELKQAERFMPRALGAEQVLPHLKEGSWLADDNQVGYLSKHHQLNWAFNPLKLSPIQQQKATAYIEFRDAYHALYSAETQTHIEQTELRSKLNETYDGFVARFGNLNEPAHVGLLKMDAGSAEILSLERFVEGKAVKADIFQQPVSFRSEEITQVGNAHEALAASLNQHGRVQMDYMQQLCGLSSEEMMHELHGQVFFNPLINDFESKDKFIAGNVISKAEEVQQYVENNPDDEPAKHSLHALQAAFPTPIPFAELDFNFGERWIPTPIYEKFASH